MKNYTLLSFILLVLFSLNSYSQNFAPVGAKWHYNIPLSSSNSIEIVKDTIVLGKNAKKTLHYPNNIYGIDIIQEDLNIVSFYSNFFNSYFKLYDFNANQGDTINVEFYTTTIPYLVDSTKMENIGGVIKKVQYITDLSGCWDFGTKFIEGIGSNRYFFPIQCTFPPPLPDSLRCYSDSLINYQLVSNCEIVGINETINQESKYNIPTLVQNQLQLPAITGDLLIYDLQGKLIKNEKIKSFVNLESLNKGIYILILKNDELFIKQKLIKF